MHPTPNEFIHREIDKPTPKIRKLSGTRLKSILSEALRMAAPASGDEPAEPEVPLPKLQRLIGCLILEAQRRDKMYLIANMYAPRRGKARKPRGQADVDETTPETPVKIETEITNQVIFERRRIERDRILTRELRADVPKAAERLNWSPDTAWDVENAETALDVHRRARKATLASIREELYGMSGVWFRHVSVNNIGEEGSCYAVFGDEEAGIPEVEIRISDHELHKSNFSEPDLEFIVCERHYIDGGFRARDWRKDSLQLFLEDILRLVGMAQERAMRSRK